MNWIQTLNTLPEDIEEEENGKMSVSEPDTNLSSADLIDLTSGLPFIRDNAMIDSSDVKLSHNAEALMRVSTHSRRQTNVDVVCAKALEPLAALLGHASSKNTLLASRMLHDELAHPVHQPESFPSLRSQLLQPHESSKTSEPNLCQSQHVHQESLSQTDKVSKKILLPVETVISTTPSNAIECLPETNINSDRKSMTNIQKPAVFIS